MHGWIENGASIKNPWAPEEILQCNPHVLAYYCKLMCTPNKRQE